MGQEKPHEAERSDDTVQANSRDPGVSKGMCAEKLHFSITSELGQIIIAPVGISSKSTAMSCRTLGLCVSETGLQFDSDPGV
jgi:hypothetical protein